MSSANKHLRNAKRHHDAATTASGHPETRAWAAVALFYSAHQLVHAVLDGESNLTEQLRHPTSHGTGPQGPLGTNTLVAQLYPRVDLHYKSLFATGKGVRYEGIQVTEQDFVDLRDHDYAEVAAWARLELEKHGRTLPPDWP
jgi:hypothetical protein